jgi:hypothetical protein
MSTSDVTNSVKEKELVKSRLRSGPKGGQPGSASAGQACLWRRITVILFVGY